MAKNKKIFYGVLVVALLAVGGISWFLLSKTGGPSGTSTSTSDKSQNECDRLEREIKDLIDKANYCNEGSDCIVSSPEICNFGCYLLFNKNVDIAPINELIAKYRVNKDCRPFLLCKCPAMPATDKIQCANNKCIDVREITITTDKTEYEQGENITITIENNLDIPAELRCCPLINFERKENDKWVLLKQWEYCPCGSPKCSLAPSWSIETKQKMIEKWDQKLILGCEGLKTVSQEASPGKYRAIATLLKNKGFDETIYSNEFTIKKIKEKKCEGLVEEECKKNPKCSSHIIMADYIGPQYAGCYEKTPMQIAEEKGDYQICNEIEETQPKWWCYILVARKNKDISICNKIEDESRVQECMKEVKQEVEK